MFIPYLNFGGNCREAFTRYQEIFGGELDLMPMSAIPDGELPPGLSPDFIAHAALVFDGHRLLASDDPADDFGPVRGMHVNYTTADQAHAERVWAALSDGGEVHMAFEQTFWSPGFGICVDRFGTPWMVNVEPAAE